jgi:hypothetical protein
MPNDGPSLSAVVASAFIAIAGTEPVDAEPPDTATGQLLGAGDSIIFTFANETDRPIQFFDSINNRHMPFFTTLKIRNETGPLFITYSNSDGWWSPLMYTSDLITIPVQLSTLAPGEFVESSWKISSMLVGDAKDALEAHCATKFCDLKVKVSVGRDEQLQTFDTFETEWIPIPPLS